MTHDRTSYTKGLCRCGVCVDANRSYQRDWARSRRRSDGEARRVSATPVKARLETLEASGWTRREISRRTGLSRSTLDAVMVAAQVNSRTRDKLWCLPDHPHARPAVQAEAAVQAIARAGWSRRALSLAVGRSRLRFRGEEVEPVTYAKLMTLASLLGAQVAADGTVLQEPLSAHLARELPLNEQVAALLG